MMRAGIACVLFILLIREGRAELEDEFRPTPIPLNEWREVRGLREPEAPPRAHYWENALRHSVYLALVRDNIDRLISKGHFDDPAQDVDDRDLWRKVKYAPFDKMTAADPPLGDVAVMAKGRLMEEPGGFRFTADDKHKHKCTSEKCADGVRALWSVKRVRQRDPDVSPGHYHYELTFSVITQHKKQKKHHEKPARTFTVRESDPESVMDAPQENRYYEPLPIPVQQPPRAERALWFHKNILPARSQARQHHGGLDRLFSSLFSDDDDDVPQTRYKPKQYLPQAYQQYSKVGYVGSPSEQHQQKKLNPYGPKPHSYKYGRPMPPPPQPSHPQHHYLDIDAIGVVSGPYIQPPDHRHGPPNKQSKTPRPPVLPTPPNPVLPQKNFTVETTTKLKPNRTEESTQQPEIVNTPHKTYSKHKQTVKISYVTDHVRPPVYNAPPGVFVTMDKKPFKPMPPLRLVHSTKHHKTTRPVDFRPSPQVLDIQFSEPDPLFDTAFRPITVNYANSNTTEKAVTDSHVRKPDSTKKPPKKHEIVKEQRVSTTAPEIITAHSIEDDSDAEWTNVLGAFAKTTPMAAEKDKSKAPETTTVPITTSTTTTTAAPTTTVRKRVTTTTTTEAPTTTPKPKKRTRPPPKFSKPEKEKKHKRITTTTTEVPEKPKDRDLTPQASSASATAQTSSTTSSTTTSTTTTTTTTTTQAPTTPVQKTTTTEQPSSTTTEAQLTPAHESDYTKRRNRFRQSTLKYRSTSEKNDKKDEKARTILPPTGIPPRRKGSKFQDHVPSSTPKNTDKQYDDRGRENHVVSPYKSRTTEAATTEQVTSTKPTTPAYEEVADRIYITSASPEYSMAQEDDFDDDSEESGENEQESRGHAEYVPSTAAALTPSEKTNEITDENEDESLEENDEATTTTTPKNKPKCKKKLNNLNNTTVETKSETTETEVTKPETTTVIMTSTTTEKAVTPDIFQEIFGGFTFDDSPAEPENGTTAKPELEEQESINQEKFIKAEEDFEDFFEAFEDKDRHRDEKFEDQYEYEDQEPSIDDEESLFQTEEERRSPRESHVEEAYDDYEEPPYSLLELMAME